MPDIPNANKNEPSYADSQTESGKWPEALKAFLGKVVEIPLACIHPNPDNPGPEITQEMVTDLAANITEVGLQNAIKVRLRWEAPLSEGVLLHPENPLIKADGSPLGVGDFHYINLSGQLRYLAFEKLGRATIPGTILNPTPEEAVIITRADNDVRDRGWWADYQTIENLIKANPNLSQRQVAAKLKMDRDKVSRAIRLLPLLNSDARALSGGYSATKNKGIFPLSEMATAQLGNLGPESANKPGAIQKALAEGVEPPKLWPYPLIPSETQDLVRRALAVALDGHLTEAGVHSLVVSIKAGQLLEDFTPLKAPKRQAKANPSQWNHQGHQGHQEGLILGKKSQNLEPLDQPLDLAKGGAKTNQKPEIPTSVTDPIGAPPRDDNNPPHIEAIKQKLKGGEKLTTGESLVWDAIAGISVISRIKAKIKKGEKPAWWEAILLAGHTLGRAVIWLAKHAFKLVRPLLKFVGRLVLEALKSIARFFGPIFYGIAKVVMIIVLLLGVGWFGWDIYKHGIYHPLNLIESKVQHLVFRPEPPTPKADSSAPKPQVEGQALSVPISPKQEMGAPKELTQSTLGSQPVASTQTQPKPVTWPVASAKAQVQSTPTAHKDVVGQAVGSVGGDVAVDVAKKLFGL